MEKEMEEDVVRLERESVINIPKTDLVMKLTSLIGENDRAEFEKFCRRVEYTIRAWYFLQSEDLMKSYAFFDPINGEEFLNKWHNMTSDKIESHELSFLTDLFQVMEKSNFKLLSDQEYEIARSGQYLLNLPIKVDKPKLDDKMLTRYFNEHPHGNPPAFAENKYVIFRRGIDKNRTTGYFFMEKLDVIISRVWRLFLKITRIDRLFLKKQAMSKTDNKKNDEVYDDVEEQTIPIKRISLEKMELSIKNLLREMTIQEPTFERVIVVYRRASTTKPDQRIFVKHFKKIPMADMELVLPEKMNPSLTPMDWVKFLISTIIGVATLISYIEMPKSDIWVVVAILSGVIGYCAKIYFTFRANMVTYQNLITNSMNDNQLDSRKGTLLHLCDDVIQQEVKEVIISYYILIEQGKATIQDIDLRCELLIKEEFSEDCNFDVVDAVKKLEKLRIVSRDSIGRISCVPVKRANEIIGTTTEELVMRAQQAPGGP